MNPFLTCSSLPHPLHRSPIRSPHRQSHCRPIWAIYAVVKPSASHRAAIVIPSGAPRVCLTPKATRAASPSREAVRLRVVEDPGMRTSLPRGNREISEPAPGADPRTAPGRPEAVAGDARAGEVGPAHGSGEVGEQGGARRGGADCAKGRERGEGGTARQGPDPERGSRVPCAGPPTAGSREEQEGEA